MSTEMEIHTLPSLTERARTALAAAQSAAEEAEKDIYVGLYDEFWAFAQEVLQVDPGTLACARVTEAHKSITRKPLHPNTPQADQCLLIELDGLTFRAHFMQTKVATVEYGADGKQDIFDRKLVVELVKGAIYTPITDLATLGKAL